MRKSMLSREFRFSREISYPVSLVRGLRRGQQRGLNLTSLEALRLMEGWEPLIFGRRTANARVQWAKSCFRKGRLEEIWCWNSLGWLKSNAAEQYPRKEIKCSSLNPIVMLSVVAIWLLSSLSWFKNPFLYFRIAEQFSYNYEHCG